MFTSRKTMKLVPAAGAVVAIATVLLTSAACKSQTNASSTSSTSATSAASTGGKGAAPAVSKWCYEKFTIISQTGVIRNTNVTWNANPQDWAILRTPAVPDDTCEQAFAPFTSRLSDARSGISYRPTAVTQVNSDWTTMQGYTVAGQVFSGVTGNNPSVVYDLGGWVTSPNSSVT